MSHPHELLIPLQALANPHAREFLRAWAVDKGLQVSLISYPDAGVSAWGIILADILRHVADAHQQSEGRDREQTIREIVSVFMAEFELPTDKPHGDLISLTL